LKDEKLKGLLLAKEYGFIPMLVTLNADIEVTNLKLKTLEKNAKPDQRVDSC